MLYKCIRQVLQSKSSKKVVNQRCRSSKPLRHNSAIGDRQMLPWQMNQFFPKRFRAEGRLTVFSAIDVMILWVKKGDVHDVGLGASEKRIGPASV